MKIVLLPGLDGTGSLFEPFIQQLPKTLEPQIISYPSDDFLSYEGLSAYVLEQLPDEDFILLSESFSGPIAYQIAKTKPKHLKSLVFVASFLDNPRPMLLVLTKYFPIKWLLSITPPTFIIKSFLLGKSINDETVNLFKQILRTIPTNTLSFRLRAISSLQEQYSPISIPTIYIQATRDKLVPNSSVRLFKTLFNHLEIIPIDAPHFVLQAFPKHCADIIANEI